MQIFFDRLCAKNCNFFRKTFAVRFLISKAFQKAAFYQNLTSGSGSKQRFSLLQEKVVIQAVCLRTQAVFPLIYFFHIKMAMYSLNKNFLNPKLYRIERSYWQLEFEFCHKHMSRLGGSSCRSDIYHGA